MLTQEIEDNKRVLEEQNEKSFFLSNMIDDKVNKEDYDELETELNNEKEKNKNLKNNIDKLNEDISKKEEEIIKNKSIINSQENSIKENTSKINSLNEQIEQNNKTYNDLINKYIISNDNETKVKYYKLLLSSLKNNKETNNEFI